jgi:hypothetical protein
VKLVTACSERRFTLATGLASDNTSVIIPTEELTAVNVKTVYHLGQ